MKTFQLVTNDGEVITKTKSYTKEEAVDFFSSIKKLNKVKLLKIYKVIEE